MPQSEELEHFISNNLGNCRLFIKCSKYESPSLLSWNFCGIMVISVLNCFVRDWHAGFGIYLRKSLERSKAQNYLELTYWKEKRLFVMFLGCLFLFLSKFCHPWIKRWQCRKVWFVLRRMSSCRKCGILFLYHLQTRGLTELIMPSDGQVSQTVAYWQLVW